MKRASLLILVVAVLLGTSSFANADLIFSQDFEGSEFVVDTTLTTTGIGDSATTHGNWQKAAYSGTAGEIKVVNDQAHSGDKSIYLTRASGQSKKLEGYSTMAGVPLNSGVFEASAWLRRDSAGSTTMQLTKDSLISAITCTALYVNTAGELNYYSSAGAWVKIDGISVPEESWFGLKMVVDLDNEIFDVFYNSGSGWSEVASDKGLLSAYTGNHNVDSMLFQPSSPNGSQIWVDDCMMATVVPEPSTLALLACGLIGLLAYAWRKRK